MPFLWACVHEIPRTHAFGKRLVVAHQLHGCATVTLGKVKPHGETEEPQAGRIGTELYQTVVQLLCNLGQLTDLL